MKYIIKESRIKNLMWKYFDSYKYKIHEDDDEIILVNSDNSFDWNYTFYDGRLLVSNNIITGIEGLFNISGDNALEYAGEWFEDKYHHPVEEIINWDGWA
jgi:hypothetical protein